MALQLLYAIEVGRQTLPEALEGLSQDRSWPEEARLYGLELAERVLANRDRIEEELRASIRNWEVDRVAVVDRVVLEVAVAELLFGGEVPVKVCISEAVDLAKKYSTAQSGGFVNGVLDALARRHANPE